MGETRSIDSFLGSALEATVRRASEQLARQEAKHGSPVVPTKRSLREERLRVAGVPLEAHVRRRVLDGRLEATPALDFVRPVVAAAQSGYQFAAFVGLLGERGRGKTTAGAWAIAELGGRYVKLERAGQLRKRDRVADAHEWDAMLRAPVLVLDEVGVENHAVDGELAFLEVVDERQDNRITIVISNLSADDIATRYDPRAIDRLASVWRPHELVGPSYRQRRRWHEVLKIDERVRDPKRIAAVVESKRQFLLAKGAAHENLIELAWAEDAALELARVEGAR